MFLGKKFLAQDVNDEVVCRKQDRIPSPKARSETLQKLDYASITPATTVPPAATDFGGIKRCR